jgi:hypothetical protein
MIMASSRRALSLVSLIALGSLSLPLGLGALTPATAEAQPQMPDLRSMSGRPLPVPNLPVGTVVVRLARKMPANAAVGIDVTAVTTGANGDSRTRSAKTGPDGRATFEGIAAGSGFQASATVDGERVETTKFPVPSTGGTRVMLIAGLGAAGAEAAGAADPHAGMAPGAPGQETGETFRVGAPTGMVEPAPNLAAGTLEIDVQDAAGKPIAGLPVRLGEVQMAAGENGQVRVHDAIADGNGRVRWTGLTTGDAAGYAAVSEYQGSRISTVPFRMSADSGMRGKIFALGRTRDPSVLRLDPRTKIVIDLREDAVAVMVALFFRNTSREVFDGGEEGLFIPFPDGAVNAQEIEGGEPVEIVPGKGVRIKAPIPPDASAQFVTQARYGFILPAEGTHDLDFTQLLPVALPDPLLLVPAKTGLTLDAPGLQVQKPDTDTRGDKIDVYTVPAIGAGGSLKLTVHGIPGRDRTARTIAAGLCLLLIGAAIVLARRSGGGAKPATAAATNNGVTSDSLVDKREQIFGELVAIERQRQQEGANPRLDERRKETVGRLEAVYKELARLE